MPKGWRRPPAALGHQKTLVYESKPAGQQEGEAVAVFDLDDTLVVSKRGR